ncbi:nucleotide-diphospho-sugar transferase [Abortiporus biennis]|nr:nucleotide-diphospho-sugar transferase [Abortiporus biennis]
MRSWFETSSSNSTNQYGLLPGGGRSGGSSTKQQNAHKRRGILGWVVGIGGVVIVFLLVSKFNGKTWKAPLDNYQRLNTLPIVDIGSLPPKSPLFSKEHAIVTTLYTDAFAPAVATLGHTLRKANTSAQLIVLYFPEKISTTSLCLASSSGFTPHMVTRIPPPNGGKGVHHTFIDQFTKLQIWKLDQIGIKSLVYLDADILVKRNFDELFSLPFNFAAVPDIYVDKGFTMGFNAGVLFIHTSTAVFNDLVQKIAIADFPPQEAEQSYLNHYFGAETLRLPIAYNGNLAIKKRSKILWDGTLSEQRIVHYTIAKPFLGKKYAKVDYDKLDAFVENVAKEKSLFKEEVLWWGEMFREMKATYSSELAKCQLPQPPKASTQRKHGWFY